MADSKLKFLALYEILKNESSAIKPLTTSEICLRLEERNIVKNKRNLPREMDGLASLGYSIKKTKVGHENAFYTECSELDESEMRILLDALEAATFITPEKTKSIRNKLLAKTPESDASRLAFSNNVIFNARKAKDDLASENVAIISKAIRDNHKISFRVFDLDENGNKKYHRNSEIRTEEPVGLVYNHDNYYLLTMNLPDSEKIGDFVTYRIDHIDSVIVSEMMVSDKCIENRNNVLSSFEKTISMFTGEKVDVVLSVKNERILKYFYEQFGFSDTKIIKVAENDYFVSIKAAISPTFYGWIFQFSEDVKIVRPDNVKREYEEKANLVVEKNKRTPEEVPIAHNVQLDKPTI